MLVLQGNSQEYLARADALYTASLQQGSTDMLPVVRARSWRCFVGTEGHRVTLAISFAEGAKNIRC